MENFPFKEETYNIIGVCMEVQKILGFGFSEAVYKDAMQIEFIENGIPNDKETELKVCYKGQLLKHKFFDDFICYENIIVEVKSCDKGITDDYIAKH